VVVSCQVGRTQLSTDSPFLVVVIVRCLCIIFLGFHSSPRRCLRGSHPVGFPVGWLVVSELVEW